MTTKLEKFAEIIAKLRDPNGGCPWDLEQTYQTMPPHILEEAYEVVEAINQDDRKELKEELGDLLMQVVFLSQLAQEEGAFTLDDVIDGITDKIIRRHPHVFGEIKAENSDEVLKNWENIKQQERYQKEQFSILDNVPIALPSLLRAAKLQKRCAKVGFDWSELEPTIQKVEEELQEVRDEVSKQPQNPQTIEEEIGDLLFASVNVARHLKLNPEEALRKANLKFERRFRQVEQSILASGRQLEQVSLAEMDLIWDQVKQQEKQEDH
ncbi:nucleoside triphosphate hydrolase [Gallibacterium anatis]|uniref:Nucleoside triphosphate pyrophosphohydrolase n=1 Tax=Gallibacterium anatis TaxID=750 RepID=A0AAX3XEX8_9PAST|nr:nucleoside triphosphate pyrophosphohydrolase [Gallibacterium anatis]KGQ39736.1 nucleoside triphosphate hydrolase [Gallibacterium anatis]KGQ61832.1 nucleoside triphosphate hydrolase [Gallibacterium anatis 7990]MBP4134330.1 nucleoside triphosphate pyrophosphohydrolase [Gallibacterium anatis]MDK9429734.1 nucleoside triphosphate pyrophosphohydrolase [Gallibacterium anatis]WIM79609.1 nucleoside triphosphate pyrophosphohydrolase [Gallibacterium anatis]